MSGIATGRKHGQNEEGGGHIIINNLMKRTLQMIKENEKLRRYRLRMVNSKTFATLVLNQVLGCTILTLTPNEFS